LARVLAHTVVVMDNRAQVREFLISRRERISPAQAGLPAYGGGNRRVKGLRREEVALLAGVSIDYYVRMERGNLAGASDAVLDAITDAPAWIRNARHDMLAVNRMARALYAPLLADPRRPVNNARFIYLDPAARDFFTDWERAADDIAAMLRSEAGHNPHDKQLIELIGELSTRSEDFRVRWAAHIVRFHRTGRKRFRHPVVGPLDLDFEAMEFPARPGLTLLVYTAAAATPAADNLKLLASWAATAEQTGDLPTYA
jgi:transcriptional regulator with XRE-family HTH domain